MIDVDIEIDMTGVQEDIVDSMLAIRNLWRKTCWQKALIDHGIT